MNTKTRIVSYKISLILKKNTPVFVILSQVELRNAEISKFGNAPFAVGANSIPTLSH